MPLPRLLIVDDEPDHLETISYRLSSAGYAVAVAHSGEEALAKAAQQAPHAIFLDVVMPRMDGLETLKRLRAGGISAPVVLLTTTEQHPSALIEFQALGIAGVLRKQGRIEAFQKMLEAVLPPGGCSSS